MQVQRSDFTILKMVQATTRSWEKAIKIDKI